MKVFLYLTLFPFGSSSCQNASNRMLECNRSSIALTAACDLFSRYVTRTALDIPDFDKCKKKLVERGVAFLAISIQSRQKISNLCVNFIREKCTVLVHGFSRVVLAILINAAKQNKQFKVIVTEGRPDGQGYHTAARLLEHGLKVDLVIDSAIGAIMENVDFVLVGAEGVVENGGIINLIGTFTMAACAKAMNKPFYVATESFKFTRLYPLNQKATTPVNESPFVPCSVPAPPAVAPSCVTSPCEKKGNALTPSSPTTPGAGTFPPVSLARYASLGEFTSTASSASSSFAVDATQIADFTALSSHPQMSLLNPLTDYTPPSFITLLFTDLGILTTSAVSDELIKLYY